MLADVFCQHKQRTLSAEHITNVMSCDSISLPSISVNQVTYAKVGEKILFDQKYESFWHDLSDQGTEGTGEHLTNF